MKKHLFTLIISALTIAALAINGTSVRASAFISGPTSVSCGTTASYFFNVINDPSNPFRSCTPSWTIRFPNGTTTSGFGTAITINWGNTSGIGSLTAFAFCSDFTAESAGISVNVGGGSIATPSSLTGAPLVCNDETETITSAAVSGATSYTFTVPSGWKINGVVRTSFTTSSRSVNITAPSNGRGTAQVCVRANQSGSCGTVTSGSRCRTVRFGRQNINIIGPSVVNTNSFADWIADGVGFTNFQWTVPSGWNTFSGLNTQGILVGIDGTSGNFIIEVTAVSCGVNVGTFKEVTVSRGGGGFFRKGGEQSDEPLKDILTDGELTVFPNPAVEVINLTSGSPMKILSAEMIDLQGRRVLSQKIEDTNATLELKSVRNGIYLLNLLMEDGSIEMRKISVGQ